MRLAFWLTLGCLAGLGLTRPVSAARPVAPAPPPATETLTLHWSVPPYTLQPQTGDEGAAYLQVTVPGWPVTTEAGQPALPFSSTLVVLPPAGEVQLAVIPLAQEVRPLAQPLLPAPTLVFQQEPAGNLLSGWPAWTADPIAVPLTVQARPLPVTLTEVGRWRGVRLARLTFSPFRYDPQTAALHLVRAVAIRLQFPPVPPVTVSPPDPLRAALRPLVLNPEALASWTTTPAIATSFTPTFPLTATWQFTVSAPGLYALPWEQLRTAGVITAGADPAYVQLYHAGQEVALQWEAAAGRFLFYADPAPTRWAAYDTYRLAYGNHPGRRIESRSGAPDGLPDSTAWATAWAAENRAYDSLYAAPRDGDHWYWQCLALPAGGECLATATYPLTLTTPLTTGAAATLTLWLQGYTASPLNPDHRLQVAFNGVALGEVAWDGKTPFTPTLPVPPTALHPGPNALSLTLTLTGGVWLEALALQYPLRSLPALTFTGQLSPAAYTLSGWQPGTRLYDVTDAHAPLLVTGAALSGTTLRVGDDRPGPRTYLPTPPAAVLTLTTLQPVQRLTEPVGATYLALAPTAFITALQPLLNLRAAQGLQPVVAPLEAIYDTYGDGRMNPEALRTFIAHAYATWSPRPVYLLLVGDGTWDPLDHLKTGTPTLLPPYLAPADPWLGEVPADNRYAAVEGADHLPDLVVGRLPVNTPAELTTVVAKLIHYETETAPGGWNLRHLFVTDDADPAGNFPAAAAQVMALVPPTHTVVSLSCTDDPTDPTRCANLSALRPALLSQWNQGALLLNWVGHSAFQQWEHGRLFHTDDLSALTNAGRLPVVVEMSCYTGHFAHPVPLQTALDEALVRRPHAGAIAAWGSSGAGLGEDHTPLHQAFYQALLAETNPPVGVATTVARLALAGGPGAYLIDTYHLFGDPALQLARTPIPWAASLYLPLVRRDP